MTHHILHTVIVANRDNEGHEASRIHAALELALAGLGVPTTLVAVTTCRIVQRTPLAVLRVPATKYEVIDTAKVAVGGTNHGYAGGWVLDDTVASLCAGTDIIWRVIHGNA